MQKGENMANNSSKHCFLSGENIRSTLFEGDATVRPVSLDLKVDFVIRGKEKYETITLKPQQMVTVILDGKVKIPNNCFGIAYPKTSLCQKGIHILNTGIIDPGYNGYLSTVAINYSKENREIRKGDVYLRLIVYQNQHSYPEVEEKNSAQEDYISKMFAESKSYPKTFLDIPNSVKKLVEKTTKKVSKKVWRTALFILGLFAVVSLIIVFTTFAIGNSRIIELKNSEVIDFKLNEELQSMNTKYEEILSKLKLIEEKQHSEQNKGNTNNEQE